MNYWICILGYYSIPAIFEFLKVPIKRSQIKDILTGNNARILILSLFVLGGLIVLFEGSGTYSLKQWDESRRAVNAIEMMEQDSWRYVKRATGKSSMSYLNILSYIKKMARVPL